MRGLMRFCESVNAPLASVTLKGVISPSMEANGFLRVKIPSPASRSQGNGDRESIYGARRATAHAWRSEPRGSTPGARRGLSTTEAARRVGTSPQGVSNVLASCRRGLSSHGAPSRRVGMGIAGKVKYWAYVVWYVVLIPYTITRYYLDCFSPSR